MTRIRIRIKAGPRYGSVRIRIRITLRVVQEEQPHLTLLEALGELAARWNRSTRQNTINQSILKYSYQLISSVGMTAIL